jgi:peptidoglycan/xylan/chitin deacetylase (PgdA/CDA1 family)
LEVARQKEAVLKAVCPLYHDVVEDSDWESSGFTGPGTARYKLDKAEFESHLAAIDSARKTPAALAPDLRQDGEFPFLLTFDDGGISAATCIAALLEKHGWRGHFFVTASKVGHRGFLSQAQVRDLGQRAHVIGSHTFSHPVRMSHCSREELLYEWTSSIELLSEILGNRVTTASVSGGYYSTRVGKQQQKRGFACYLPPSRRPRF